MFARVLMLVAGSTACAVPALSAEENKTAVCLPVAKAVWEATVEVFDAKLAGKPKFQAAREDPSDTLLVMADGMESADSCAQALALYGTDGIKALMLKSMREDLANGKYPRIFD